VSGSDRPIFRLLIAQERRANKLITLQDGAILRGDRYTLCPDCTQNEAAGNAGKNAMCRNAAFRLRSPKKSFSKDNIMFVCCAVNQLVRNQNEKSTLFKHQLDLLTMRMTFQDFRGDQESGM
jgi:hypothetical protein